MLLMISCSSENNYIVPVDFYTHLMPDTVNGETVEQSMEKHRRFRELILENTIGKEIPPVNVIDMLGDTVNLKDHLSGKMIIISCDAHCGFSMEHATNDFQVALKKLAEDDVYPRVLCLMIKDPVDYLHPDNFERDLKELKDFYNTESIFILDSKDAQTLNLYSGTIRLIIDEHHQVISMGSGISISDKDKILNEINPYFNNHAE
jgi:hypothetical protein